ncbi:hypothetical protein BC936DRAFT_139676 [Jimgerdemannia flammicorona]|uniref:Peptidase S8/S53 domain-containing protein n=1 Tax=Jimgerdemannia flammicorona TaxID=994334 RepID=A0A433DHJ0_9FUNG|nr:hypothetical protein BC936DRAFT_139676 [Jimgerdemannia flammicorona]
MRTNTTTQLRPAFWHGFLLICIVFTLPISFASKHNRTVRRSVPVRHLAVFNRPIPDAILANLTSDVDGNLTRRAFGRRDNDGSISLSGDILHFGNKTHVLLYPLTEAQIAWLAQHEFVDVVEEDRVVKIQDWKKERKKTSDSSNPIRERIIGADQNYTIVTQNTSSWGLSRIDQRTLPLNNTYNYISLAGRDVDVYVIDTRVMLVSINKCNCADIIHPPLASAPLFFSLFGLAADHTKSGIQIGHPDFGGRAKWGVTIQGSNDSDDNGHGTFVAGIIGGALYGVAKQCNLIAVKSLDHEGSGTVTDILYGLQYVIEQHLLRNNTKTVINLSLGTEKSRTLNKAVNAAINAGIHITVKRMALVQFAGLPRDASPVIKNLSLPSSLPGFSAASTLTILLLC